MELSNYCGCFRQIELVPKARTFLLLFIEEHPNLHPSNNREYKGYWSLLSGSGFLSRTDS